MDGGDDTPSASGGRAVLLVEDNHLVRREMRGHLEAAGYRVRLAGNGREALLEMQSDRPDIIVSDIVMPVMDGGELAEKVRSNPATAAIPFLFVTAARDAPERVRGLRRRTDDTLGKPFSGEELVTRVERVLERAAKLAALESAGDALRGHSSHLSLPDLFQILGANGQDGGLRLTEPGGATGEVFFRGGRIVHATLGGLEGRKALFRLLDWVDASFEFDPLLEPDRETMGEDPATLVLEAMAHNDEVRRQVETLAGSARRYARRSTADPWSEVRELAPEEAAVFKAFARPAALPEVLDRTSIPDLEILRIVDRLVGDGLLAVVDAE